jgi:hypothetical protein
MYYIDQGKACVMDGACSMHGRIEKPMQNFGQTVWMKGYLGNLV